MTPGGGHSTFFWGRCVRPRFPKCGACELTFASEKGGLWAENFQIWGLVSWKFPNLEACELKFGWKLRLLRLKFPNFLKRGSCELTLLLEMGPLWAAGEAWKGGLQGRTSPYPLSRSVTPPNPGGQVNSLCLFFMHVQILWQGQKAVLTIVKFEFFDIFYFKFQLVSTFPICSKFCVENRLLCCDLICKWVACRSGCKRFWKSALHLGIGMLNVCTKVFEHPPFPMV